MSLNFNLIQSDIKERKIVDYLGLLLILALVIAYRYRVLELFAFVYTDSDQNIMWGGLNDYAEGHFYEPRFYGQAYNTFLEALLAVPFYRSGMPAYKALPMITGIISLIPFILLSLFTFFKRSVIISYIILSVPLLMAPEYAFITSMPRGFVTGVFFAGLGCIPVFYEKSKPGFFLAALMAALAFTVNSNAVLLSVPVLLYLFLENRKQPSFYACTGAGLLMGGLVHYLLGHFYSTHPFYSFHPLAMEYSFTSLFASFKKLDLYLNFNAPLLWHQGFMLLFLFLAIAGYFFIKKEYNKAVPVLIIPFMVIATFGITKVHDGNGSVFFHEARMYLALPVLLCWCISFFTLQRNFRMYYLWLIVPFYFYLTQLGLLKETVSKSIQPRSDDVVIVSPVKPIIENCKSLNSISKEHHVELFVVVDHFYSDAYASGCAACEADFPKTLKSAADRRTWRYLEDEQLVYKTVMFIDLNNKIGEHSSLLKKIPGTPDLYLVENNTLKTMVLLDSLGIDYRQYK